jgi:hypothetical protein
MASFAKWAGVLEWIFPLSFDLVPKLGNLLCHELANGSTEHLFARRSG